MKRTVRDRTENRPQAVERIELDEGHSRARVVILILAIVVALTAFGYGIVNKATVNSGWRDIEVNSREINCGQDFVFTYHLGSSGISAAREAKALTIVYTEACETAYRVFSSRDWFEDVGNLCAVNVNVNQPVRVHPALYEAFELMERLDSRYAYLAPVYDEYSSVFFCNDDWETAGFDPWQNEDVAAYCARAAGFARNADDVRVQLLGDNTVRLNVSDEYLAFAEEYGIERFVDFYWMTDAFVIDYLAQQLRDAGYTLGALSSHDGFVRCLGGEGMSFSYMVHDIPAEGLIAAVARMDYPGDTALVNLHSFPLNTQKEIYYYQFEDGTFRSAIADIEDGLSKGVTPAMIATSDSVGCAEMLLKLLPLYATDTLDEAALAALTEEKIHPLYCLGSEIVTTDPSVTLADVAEGYTVR